MSFYASEFSRLRLQASQADLADETGKVEKVNQVFLQYTHSLYHMAHISLNRENLPFERGGSRTYKLLGL